jgi:hypothetical protein
MRQRPFLFYPKMAFTKTFDLNFHYYQRNTKYYERVLHGAMPLFFQVGNIRSRIDPPDAFLLASKRLRAGGLIPSG